MVQSPARHPSGRSWVLQALVGRRRLGPAGAGLLERRWRFQPRLEALERRNLFTVNVLNNYTGFSLNGPPDTCGAAGPTSYVETVNQSLAIFTTKTSNSPNVFDNFNHFWFTTGGLARASMTSGLSDPIVVWDDQVNRFIVGDQDVDNTNHVDTFDVAVSKSASPATLGTADWNFYRIVTTETGRNADYPGNFGYNTDAFVFTLNQNQAVSGAGSDVQVVSAKISDLVAGNALTVGTNLFLNDISGFSIRPTVMHDSKAGDPMWLIESTAGNDNTISVIKMPNVLSAAPGFITYSRGVNPYLSVVQPLQPDGTGIPPASGNGALWTHILKAAEYNNSIVACDQVSVSATEDDTRWYRINVSDVNNPTIADQGNVSSGDHTYDVFAAIDINSKGDIGMTFIQSGTGTGQFMSMYVTGRRAGDAAGTMQTPVLVPAGTGTTNNKTGREGDLGGISLDSTPLTVTPPLTQFAFEGASQFFSLGGFSDFEGDFWGANEWGAPGPAMNPAAGLAGTAICQFSFVGAKGPWTVDVTWGDGTPDDVFTATAPGTIASRSHTYGEEGTKSGTIKVTDTSDGRSASATFTVVVSDPAVQATGVPVSAVEGLAFTGKTVATFTDPGGAEPNPSDLVDGIASHYKVVSIDWGDSTPLDTTSGAISYSGAPGSTTDPFTITGSHTYGEEGTYTITVIIDHEGVTTTVTTTAKVSDPAVVATGVDVSAKECIAFALPVATFTDPGGAEPNPSDPATPLSQHYTATTDWGDSTPVSTDTIAFSGTPGSKTDPFTVTGTHTFAEEGTFTITTTINHEGIITVVKSTATVRDNFGLLVLDPSGDKALMVTGNGSVTVTNCGAVVVDSSDPRAIFLTGNATVTAAETDVTGDVVTHGHASLSGELNHEAATPDPLGLGLPPAPATMFAAVHYSGSAPLTLAPGTYVGGIFIDGSGPVTLLPGVYYMKGGGFTVTGKGSVTGSGVLIVNAPSGPSDTIKFAGQGAVTLSAPTGLTGALAPYNGITILQDPASDNTIAVTGQASLTMTGVLYAPNALLKIDGHGNVVVSAFAPGTLSLGGEVIVFDAMVTGNGALTINADPAVGGGASAPVGHGPLLPLGGGQQLDGNSLSSIWVTRWGESTTSAHQPVLDQLFSSNSGGTGAALSGESKGAQPNRSIAPWADPLSGQLVDELVSSLVGVA